MRDIFLSYASTDRDRAARLVEVLEASGWTVWWDRRLPVGKNYEEEIQRRLEESRSVVVLWSRASVASRWVKAEAQDAADEERLFPAFLEPVKAPLEYRYLNGIDLSRWDGSPMDAELVRLHEALLARIGRPSRAAAPPATPWPAPPQAAGDGPRTETALGATRSDPAPDRPGEVTAMQMIANELTEILERVAARRSRRTRPDGGTGDVTLARLISRRLAEALSDFADSRGRLLPSTLALRYLAWAFAVPTLLLLVFHALMLLNHGLH